MKEQMNLVDDFTDEDKVVSDIEFWDYKQKDATIIGVFKNWAKDQYGQHAILLVGDEKELHIPNLTALNGRLENVKEGMKVKIVSLGEKKSDKTGRNYWDFAVFLKE